jgi:hypothetical protein
MTYGTHEPATSSMFQKRHEIERNKQVAKYQVPKIIQEKKLLLYTEDDTWVPFCRNGLNVSKAARVERKNK